MNFRRCCSVLSLVLIYQSNAFAIPILDVRNGVIYGANGVDVAGLLYDATFVDGTCASVHGSCEESSFIFSDVRNGAETAAQSLALQVLLDGPLGNFDSELSSINGCFTATTFCNILTASGILQSGGFSGFSFSNASSEPGDIIIYESNSFGGDTFGRNTVFANWTLSSVTPLSEPSAIVLCLVGLSVIALRQPRNRNWS